jgi:hypothetical protein
MPPAGIETGFRVCSQSLSYTICYNLKRNEREIKTGKQKKDLKAGRKREK